MPLFTALIILVKVHCNDGLEACISLLLFFVCYFRTTCILWRSLNVYHIQLCTNMCSSVELPSHFPTSYVSIEHFHTWIPTTAITQYPWKHGHCYLFLGIRYWELLWPVPLIFQDIVVSPRPSCLCYCPGSLKVPQLWAFSNKIRRMCVRVCVQIPLFDSSISYAPISDCSFTKIAYINLFCSSLCNAIQQTPSKYVWLTTISI